MKDPKRQQHVDLPQHTKISGRFDQYRSSYWAAAVALLSMRYLMPPFVRKNWENPKASFFARHSYAAWGGGIMYGAVAFYAWRTWKDISNVFSEALAWEFDKKPEDVSFTDFLRSKNAIVKSTMQKYASYNIRRTLVNSVFFAPFILKPVAKKYDWHGETGVHLGVAANGAYLFSDVMGRRSTAFEDLQSIIDRKVNHVDNATDQITASDLMNIYEHHANGVKGTFMLQRGTPEWEQSVQQFDRIADLMNQTYRNDVKTEEANFTFPKFVYLIGHGLINPAQPDRTHAYVEIANRYGMQEIKKLQKAVDDGASIDALIIRYAIPPKPGRSNSDDEKPRDSTLAVSAYGMKQALNKNKNELSMAEREKLRNKDTLIEGIII